MNILSIVTNKKRLNSTFFMSENCVFIPIAAIAQTKSQLEIVTELLIIKSGNSTLFARNAVAKKPKINIGKFKTLRSLELYQYDTARITTGSARTLTILKKVAKIPASSFIEYPAPTT